MSTPDLNLLVTLNVLLTEGSVVGAARRLRLSSSAMSRTLTRLRDVPGVVRPYSDQAAATLLSERGQTALLLRDQGAVALRTITGGTAAALPPTIVLTLALQVVESLDANGTPSCHLRGTVDPERLRPWLSATHVGEFMTLSFNPLGVAPGRPADSGSWAGLGAIDVTVQFPGQVLSTTGDADGNAVHFRDADQLTRPYGLRADALDHPGPAWVVIGPVAGFVGGVLAAGLGVMLWRRRRRTGEEPESGQDDLIATDADDLIGPAAVDGSAVEPSDAWSAAGAARPAQPRTPAAPPPAVPSVIPGATPDPVPPRRRPDDSVWAPPGDP